MFVYRRSTSQAVAAVSQAGKLDADSGIVIRAIRGAKRTLSTRPTVGSLPRSHSRQRWHQLPTSAALTVGAESRSYHNSSNSGGRGGSYNGKNSSRTAWSTKGDLVTVAGLVAAATIASVASNFQEKNSPSYCEKSSSVPQPPQNAKVPTTAVGARENSEEKTYPILSKAEVAKHTSKEAGGVWVTYDGGVYDITEFIASHPGGASRISMAAGGALEPFWKLYALHKKDEVLDILATLRIGSLSAEDMAEAKAQEQDSNDPYAKDPSRHPFFVVNTAKPFNAEPPPELLLDAGFITPNELYYVRNHLPVPEVDAQTYRLKVEIGGKAARCLSYSLEDLKTKFPHTKVVTAVQCAGNRREDMTAIKPVKGLSWSCGAVSNSEWTGVRLRDVLRHAGVDVNEPEKDGIEHIQFEGLDRDLTTCYGSSIPADMAVDPRGDVLLAFEMNGEPIPRDHGYPIRAVVPGVVGARNVKWLAKVIASAEESKNHWQQKDYKGFHSSESWETADFSKSPAIQSLPVNSAILSPADGTTVSPYDETVTIKGYALSGGGRAVIRVDVSADGGKTWKSAELKPTGQPLNRTYAWTLWEASLPVPKDGKVMDVVCKAIDSGYNSQPERPEPIWNIRGVLSNSWHRVGLKVEEEE